MSCHDRFPLMKKYFIPVLVALISLYAMKLRLLQFAHHNICCDESYQLDQMRGTFWEMVQGFTRSEFASYLSGDYYLIFPFFKIFSYNKWGLAIPHIISTLISFYLLYLLSRRFFKSPVGYIVTFVLVALNNTLIEHATQIRTYAVLPTLALANLYFWLKLVDSNYEIRKSTKIWFAIFFIMTIWFHVYGILIFGFPCLFALATKIRDKSFVPVFKNTFLFGMVVCGIAAPLWLLSVLGPRCVTTHMDFINTFQYIPNPLENLTGFLKGIFGNLIGFRGNYFLLLGIFFPFVINSKDRLEQIMFLIVLVILPIAVILIGNVLTHYWFIQRLFIWVMPFFALFLGWSWDTVFIHFKNKLFYGKKK